MRYHRYSEEKTVQIGKFSFNWSWNDRKVDAKTTFSGSELQICEAATGKARPPMVESLTGGKSRQLVLTERSARRPGMLATRVSGPVYRDEVCKVGMCRHTYVCG